jgi:hypothetical protein
MFFASIDAKNAYHQIILNEKTQELLSIKTPIGQKQPQFMPEGVSIAAFILQKVVMDVFRGFEEFMIVLADNFLIMAKDEEELEEKLDLVYKRCIERNVIINLNKSEIGHQKVDFWGYSISKDGYKVSEKRLQGITDFKFPDAALTKKVKKTMIQSFLGTALVCKDFVHDYSHHTARLNEMTHNNFNWDESTWITDYRAEDGIVYVVKLQMIKYLSKQKIIQFHIPVFNMNISVNNDVYEDFIRWENVRKNQIVEWIKYY